MKTMDNGDDNDNDNGNNNGNDKQSIVAAFLAINPMHILTTAFLTVNLVYFNTWRLIVMIDNRK
jgi:hypothetical protein